MVYRSPTFTPWDLGLLGGPVGGGGGKPEAAPTPGKAEATGAAPAPPATTCPMFNKRRFNNYS